MKKTLSLVLVLTMMLSLFSFTSASAEAPVEINILAQIWTPYEEEQRDVFAKIQGRFQRARVLHHCYRQAA